MRRPILLAVLCVAALAGAASDAVEDHRAWQHGIDLLRIGERLLLVWGSAGHPPRRDPGPDWSHDIYYTWLDSPATQPAASGAELPVRILVSLPEAQEPPSVTINSKGTILITSEDGNGGINQQAGLWNSALEVRRSYPFPIGRGGHSGHAAALGDLFLVAYGEGWVAGGGWRGLGTGKSIHARIVRDDGTLLPEIALASGHRDSWPLVAGSETNWLVVWQRYPALTLESALVNVAGDVVRRNRIIDDLAPRYAYDVGYSPDLRAYIAAGSAAQGGFVSLINLSGDIVRTQRGLPPMASESRIVLGLDGSRIIGAYPVRPRGIAIVHLSANAIELVRVIDHPHVWEDAGTTGAFVAPGRILFATLSTSGLRLLPFSIRN